MYISWTVYSKAHYPYRAARLWRAVSPPRAFGHHWVRRALKQRKAVQHGNCPCPCSALWNREAVVRLVRGFELCLTSSEHENRMGLPVLLVHMQLFTEFCGVHC